MTKNEHETNNYYEIAKKTTDAIIYSFEYPRSIVPAQCNSTLDLQIKKYPKILKISARAMYLFDRQKLALRGHHESTADQEISNNPGNFIIQD